MEDDDIWDKRWDTRCKRSYKVQIEPDEGVEA